MKCPAMGIRSPRKKNKIPRIVIFEQAAGINQVQVGAKCNIQNIALDECQLPHFEDHPQAAAIYFIQEEALSLRVLIKRRTSMALARVIG